MSYTGPYFRYEERKREEEERKKNETFIDKILNVINKIIGIAIVLLLFVGFPSGVIWVMCCAIPTPMVKEYTECSPHKTKPDTTVCEPKKEYVYPPKGYQFYQK